MENLIKNKQYNNKLGIIGWFYAGKYWIERYAYILHRITGFGLIFYLLFHVFVTGERAKGEEAWKNIMGFLNQPLFKFLEYLILVAFLYHAINGFRLILTELAIFLGKPASPKYPYVTSINRQRILFFILMISAAILIIFSSLEFFKLI